MDIFKIAELIFNFFMGKKRSAEISVEILNQVRRILILVVITVGALTMFCMGMSHLIERILNNLDEGQIVFSPAIGVILFFLFICVGVLIYSTNKKRWLSIFKKERNAEETSQHKIGSQIESVVSLLILDIIKEREYKRENRNTSRNGEQDA
jgi:type VI protein secretion system component VasK